ncbi:MAG: penicillin-binding protein 1C [Parasphingorhabdus sp.]|jgi:penicillin-binding protein 1C
MAYRRLKALSLCVGLCGVGVFAFDHWVSNAELPSLVVPTSQTVVDRNGELLRAYTVSDGRWRLPVNVGDVDPNYLDYLIRYEDKRFYSHSGVDGFAVVRAIGQAVINGRIVSGASTLTMQVARLLEQGKTGRWKGKLRQLRVALALERMLDKDTILHLYLKLAPFGGNLEGVRAASLAYFAKEPKRLTPAQSALLVALPQSPEKRRPDRAPAHTLTVRNRVLDRLANQGILAHDEARAAMTEMLPIKRQQFPAIAPHVADRVVRDNPLASINTLTLDKSLQQSLEKLAVQKISSDQNGMSVAILVTDYQSGNIIASVGSAAYLDHDRQGFIDMTQAVRSPGSTLKPVIFGLAFDQGLAHPETLIDDRPVSFGSYTPQNFDKNFRGTLRVREALQLSLNIPTVTLLQALGPTSLISRMQAAGVTAQLPAGGPPGLAIGLGGVGLTLEDLVKLYASIANDGVPITMRMVANDHREESGKRLMSASAAWHIGDILSGVIGPAYAPKNHLAYKTGTSYGHRDAWAIGFDGQHVVGVWTGRPDGASIPGMFGASVAAPILFDSFARLKTNLVPLAAPPPETLLVNNAGLPLPLKRFRSRNAVFEKPADAPVITFPPNGARVDLGYSGQHQQPLVLKVRNGRPPFTWVADGTPVLIAVHDRQAFFTPDGPGHLNLSVIDTDGLSQNVQVVVD